MSREVDLIKIAIDHLLGTELLPENGWTYQDVSILERLSKEKFDIVRK